MGKVVKKAGKALGKVAKGVGKVVKGVAKGIKGLAKGVVTGIKKVAGGAMKLLGKLGPIGTLGISLLLPGIGTAFAGMWNGAATAMVGNTLGGTMGSLVSAVGKGMQFISKGVSFFKTGVGNITDKITGVFKQIGGSISEGASNLWNSAKKFVGIEPSKMPADLGKAVGENALNMSQSTVSTPKLADAAVNIPDVAGQMSPATPSISTVDIPGLTTDKFGNVISTESSQVLNPDSIGYKFDKAAGVEMGDPTQMSQLQTGGLQNTALQDAATSSRITSFDPTSRAISSQRRTNKIGKSLLDAAQKGLENFGMDQGMTPYMAPFSSAGIDPATGTQRGGVGGEGAAGGTFLTQAQLAQQEMLRRQLQAQG